MEQLDPVTRRPLPQDSIQRILFIVPNVHVYTIPPLTSMQGHKAATWTLPPSKQIFTGRIRVLETSSSPSTFKVDLVIENADSGELFVAAPFADANVIEPATDSSRFFAVTVRDEANRKAFLGIGFEDRSDAFDFSVAVQQAYKTLGWITDPAATEKAKNAEADEKKDYSLKEGQTITVNFKGRRRPERQDDPFETASSGSSFSLPPPPSKSGGGGFSLPPPPSASDVKSKRLSLKDMGFDNGASGEFE
ncbi:hypothetical protein VHEMI05892 [[Torrubiella] hemipterigena]|uniref:NECAP PHear domain-containing protein n=1 Tax=[Torrubiella] hemipterigena TaxID=1531966 RepID=A0A0A1SZ37_9HYPO|nr:hypothetical protein VHEMI05892 [[Torrubiella] hemipterigena]